MGWLIGLGGFILGFVAGQKLLLYIMRDISAEEVLRMMKEDRGAKIKYGFLNWGLAIGGAFLAVTAWRLWRAPG